MDDKHLEELFALPIGLELEASVDGEKFYTSDGLKKAFMKAIGASSRTSNIYDQIESLVIKKRILVPCYMSKSVFRLFKHKMWGNPEDKSILGFYHLKQKRVFIVLDNNVSYIGTAANDELASTTMHECVHLYADRMKGKFISLFKEELERYYSSFFSRVFKIKKKISYLPISKFLAKYEYNRGNDINKQLAKYYVLIEKEIKPHSGLSDEDFYNMLRKIIFSIKTSFINFNAFLRMYRQNMDIYGPLDRAYLDAFGKENRVSGVYQELSSVSEVICILSEVRPTYPKIQKMFKDMA